MVAKKITLGGLGSIMISPISIKDKDYETVDPAGNSVKRTTVGERAKTVYINDEGAEVSSSMLCKKIVVEEEEIIAPKFKVTKEVLADDIDTTDDNTLVYRALDRKFYSVVTDNEDIKKLILEDNKSLEFPFTAGNGWKVWKAVLFNWSGKLLMVCCRGDLGKELEKYNDDTVEFEVEMIPEKKNMKKLVKALAF